MTQQCKECYALKLAEASTDTNHLTQGTRVNTRRGELMVDNPQGARIKPREDTATKRSTGEGGGQGKEVGDELI